MSTYPTLESVLSDRAIDWELDESEMAENLLYELQNAEFRSKFENELKSAFEDPRWSWMAKLREFRVYAAQTEEEAVDIAKRMLLYVAFPEAIRSKNA